MIKILKNPDTVNDVGPIDDVGEVVIPASGQRTLDPLHFPKWARSADTAALLGAGTLVMNDGTNDLTPAEGIRLLQTQHQVIVQKGDTDKDRVVNTINFETGAFDVVDEGDGKLTVSIPSDNDDIDDDRLIHIKCVENGTCDPMVGASILIDQTKCFIKKEDC